MIEPLRTIVVLGGGTAGWMAAAMLAQFVPPATRINVVASDTIGTVGVGEATIPQIRLLTAALGLDERKMLAATQGTFKLGIEFVDWRHMGHRYMHAFGQVGRGLGVTPFHHHWLRARHGGADEPLEAYTPTAGAAAEGRFGRTEPSKGDLSYAYHFDAALLAALLRRVAQANGVLFTEGEVAAVRRAEDGDVAALCLLDGREIEGDFFIDCSGFRALLIGEALRVGYQDWSHWLPCDRAIAVPSTGNGKLAPATRATARPVGWQWRIPLQHRVGNGLVYASAELSDDEAAARLLATIDGAPMAALRPLRFVAGKRDRFWERNVVAMGLASGFLEPLESTSIHLVQSAVARLLEAFPGRHGNQGARDWYNRKAHAELDRIRDFLILHYHATRREEPFWRRLREMTLPEALTEKIARFRSSGAIAVEPGELFTEPGWLQVMVGQGIVPDRWSPLAERLPPADLSRFLADVRRETAAQVATLPDHGQFVATHCRAAEL